MRELIPTFPRQVACPERITCLTEQEFYKVVNSVNGIKPKVYFSLYKTNELGKFTDKDWTTSIDKISFDLDSASAIINAKKISDWCLEHNYRHCIIYSTGGLWIHIKTKNYEKLKYPKQALKNSQLCIAGKLSLTVGMTKQDDIDQHIIGDIARVARMPSTLDTHRRRFAQSIQRDDLTHIGYLKTLSRKQSDKIYWYGDEGFDISEFDTAPMIADITIPELDSYEVKLENPSAILVHMPPCIIEILQNAERATWRGRWLAALYFRERGLPPNLCDELCREHFSKHPRTDYLGNNYNHFRKVKVLELVYGNSELFFPRCESLYNEGWCPGKCKYYNSLYCKI